MKVLLSIKPEHAANILNGSKQFEFRKVGFKAQPVRTIVVYVTKPLGKIVGEFDVEGILSDVPEKIWVKTSHAAGISEEQFTRYFEGKRRAYAIKVGKVRRYRQPRDLRSILPNGVAPQSFQYLLPPTSSSEDAMRDRHALEGIL
jgi:predicted transcriptional regulator